MNPHLTLTHIYEEPDDQALGILQMESKSWGLFTNEPGIQEEHPRLPDGDYLCKWIHSPTYGWTWTLVREGVVSAEPDGSTPRSQCRIHWGNRDEASLGCVLTGMHIGWYQGEPAVMRSKVAFNFLKAHVGERDFDLTIRTGLLVETGEQNG